MSGLFCIVNLLDVGNYKYIFFMDFNFRQNQNDVKYSYDKC